MLATRWFRGTDPPWSGNGSVPSCRASWTGLSLALFFFLYIEAVVHSYHIDTVVGSCVCGRATEATCTKRPLRTRQHVSSVLLKDRECWEGFELPTFQLSDNQLYLPSSRRARPLAVIFKLPRSAEWGRDGGEEPRKEEGNLPANLPQLAAKKKKKKKKVCSAFVSCFSSCIPGQRQLLVPAEVRFGHSGWQSGWVR